MIEVAQRIARPLVGAWPYRHYILGAIYKEFRARFARSRLGAAWAVLNPLAMVAVYALVLSAVLSARLPGIDSRFAYAIYLTSGIFAWTLFSDVLARCTRLFVENADLLKKVAFPRIALPLVVLGVAVVDNLLLFLAIVVIFGLLGHWPGLHILWLPVLLVLNLGLALGLGLTLGSLNVFVRDVSQLLPIALQFGFWLTPIVYMVNILPPALHAVLSLSPLYHLVTAYQAVLVFNQPPAVLSLLYLGVLSFALMWLALEVFRRSAYEMVDVL